MHLLTLRLLLTSLAIALPAASTAHTYQDAPSNQSHATTLSKSANLFVNNPTEPITTLFSHPTPLATPLDPGSPDTNPAVAAQAAAGTKTHAYQPSVMLFPLAAPPGAHATVLPFHYTLTEYCTPAAFPFPPAPSPSSATPSLAPSTAPVLRANGTYSNGNLLIPSYFPGFAYAMDHMVSGFPRLVVGYDVVRRGVVFEYRGCRWDGEGLGKGGEECGECRVGSWEGGWRGNCADLGGGGMRVKHMECSVMLGTLVKPEE